MWILYFLYGYFVFNVGHSLEKLLSFSSTKAKIVSNPTSQLIILIMTNQKAVTYFLIINILGCKFYIILFSEIWGGEIIDIFQAKIQKMNNWKFENNKSL